MVARARRAGGGKVRVSGRTAVTGPHTAERLAVRAIPRNPASWMSRYLREAALADGLCALAAALLAFGVRFDDHRQLAGLYLALSLSLPLFWLLMVMLCGGYDARIIGVGSDEFRKIVNVGLGLTAAIAVISYATKADLARGYVLVALPCATLFDLLPGSRCASGCTSAGNWAASCAGRWWLVTRQSRRISPPSWVGRAITAFRWWPPASPA